MCSICQVSVHEPYELFCGHSFHKKCIKELKKQGKTCPECGIRIEKKHFTGYDLFTLTDDRECRSCHWKPVKSVTGSDSFIHVEYVFNHHCDTCQYNCDYFEKATTRKDAIKWILASLKPKDDSVSPDMGLCLTDDATVDYSEHEFRYCLACHERVDLCGRENAPFWKPRSPQKSVSFERGCLECKSITWGTLLEKTFQDLPECGICNEIVKPHQGFKRSCCPSKWFHYECSVEHSTCPVCLKECKITFDISRRDPSMPAV